MHELITDAVSHSHIKANCLHNLTFVHKTKHGMDLSGVDEIITIDCTLIRSIHDK